MLSDLPQNISLKTKFVSVSLYFSQYFNLYHYHEKSIEANTLNSLLLWEGGCPYGERTNYQHASNFNEKDVSFMVLNIRKRSQIPHNNNIPRALVSLSLVSYQLIRQRAAIGFRFAKGLLIVSTEQHLNYQDSTSCYFKSSRYKIKKIIQLRPTKDYFAHVRYLL